MVYYCLLEHLDFLNMFFEVYGVGWPHCGEVQQANELNSHNHPMLLDGWGFAGIVIILSFH